MGNPWMPLYTTFGAAFGTDIDAQTNKSVSGVTYGGGALLTPGMLFFPGTVNIPAVLTGSLTRGVFSQATLAAKAAGVSCASGPAVMFQPDPSLWWGLTPQSISNAAQLFRGGGSLTSLVASAFAYAVNDVIRIEARIIGADTELRSYQNGVLRNTFLDVGFKSTIGGLFGMWYISSNTGSETWKNYSGGLI
jgi:hypothetical protein